MADNEEEFRSADAALVSGSSRREDENVLRGEIKQNLLLEAVRSRNYVRQGYRFDLGNLVLGGRRYSRKRRLEIYRR